MKELPFESDPTVALNSSALLHSSSLEITRLVRFLAIKVLAGLPGGSGIEMSDLIQAGYLGLLKAERAWSPLYGVPLGGYAQFRVRGEMLDAVRRNLRTCRPDVITQGSTANDGTDLEGTIPASPDCSPFAAAARGQRAAILGEEVGRLPERYRAVVCLRYVRDCTLRQIGSVLSVHESRASQMNQDALRCLRRALSRRGICTISALV